MVFGPLQNPNGSKGATKPKINIWRQRIKCYLWQTSIDKQFPQNLSIKTPPLQYP